MFKKTPKVFDYNCRNAGKEVTHKEKLSWISSLEKYILPKSADQIKTLLFRRVKRFVSRKNGRINMTAGKASETGLLCLCLLKMTGESFVTEEKPIRKVIPDLYTDIVNLFRLFMAFPCLMNSLISLAR